MKRMIAIIDLTTGRVIDRASSTPTVDLPADFDRASCTAEIDVHSRVHYRSTAGRTAAIAVHARPLSFRVLGEECLVAEAAAATLAERGQLRLCAIEP